MGTTLNHFRHFPRASLAFFVLFSLHLLPATPTSDFLSYNFTHFDESNREQFHFSTDASSSQGALQITPDSRNSLDYLVNRSGRVLLNHPFKLWLPSSNSTSTTYVASFATSFTINIFREPETIPGEGFAFLIAPNLDDPPFGSHGRYLGLTNATLDGSDSNKIVAVELDTVKQDFDPDANHLGLDVNSIRSNATASLTPFGIDIAPVNPANYTVWIDYDGISRRVSVYMAFQNRSKPTSALLRADLDLSEHLLPNSYFGFAASTGSDFQLNCVIAWNLTVEKLPDDDESDGRKIQGWKWALMIGLPLLAVIVGIIMWSYYVIKKRKIGGKYPMLELSGTLKSLPGTPREFDFKVLRKATNNFDEGMKLGEGGFGIVYKGVIPGEETEVAVKKFSRDNMKGQDDFLAELTIINRLRHKHLVRLHGWCHKNGMLLLVYEYMPNGSLDHHLFGGGPILSWAQRYNIVSGVASALHYLHDHYEQTVVHRDLKASNVLLDSSFNARLGDFGLARTIDSDNTSYAGDRDLPGVPGTLGYIAPECFHTGRATPHSDVFGFGALLLEVVTGRHPRCDNIDKFQFLADWVWKLYREDRILEAVDERLRSDFAAEDAVRLLMLGLACSHPAPKERPKAAEIVQIIANSAAPPVVPPFRPPFVWPSGPTYDEEIMTADRVSSMMNIMSSSSSYFASSSEADQWPPQCVSRD